MRAEFYLTHPASDWEKGLPVGNGRMGAVVYGGTGKEKILLNEESFWFGKKQHRLQPLKKETLEYIRRLLADGRVEEAEFLSKMHVAGAPKYINPYVPAAFLEITFCGMHDEIKDYRRTLDMENGVAAVEFQCGEIRHKRVCFADFATGTICIRMETSEKCGLTFQTNLNRRPFEEISEREGKLLLMKGNLGGGGRNYTVSAMLGETDGEECSAGDYLAVKGASYAELFLWAGTADEGFADGEAKERCREAATRGIAGLFEKNSARFRELFERVDFSLDSMAEGDFSADELLQDCENPGKAARLSWLQFHYGRYLLASSSLDCRYPANLQGIWNGSFTPSWESAYTININLQMNYWMADACGLSECWKPMIDLLERMEENGRKTAKEVYSCRGVVAHHNTNIWGDTDVNGIWQPACVWPMGFAWLCLEMYRHYQYHKEAKLKAKVQNFMGEAVLFFYDYLWKKEDGWHTGPSVSPENTYELPDGSRGNLCMSPAMDREILTELCKAYLECTQESEDCGERRSMAEEILAHVPGVLAGTDGRVSEWMEEYGEPEPGHRHISHLYSLYPGTDWGFEENEWLDAAEKTLRTRLKNGGGHTGWSRIWILCFFARLGKEKDFGQQLTAWFKNSVYENLWDAHPPFQIDGNLGYCAAVSEALVQRRGNRIYLLPAIPDFWTEGSIKGLRVPNGVQIGMKWKNGKLLEVDLTAEAVQSVILCRDGRQEKANLAPGQLCKICWEKE